MTYFFKDKNLNIPKIEEAVLKFWKENQIFEKSLRQRQKAKKFIFYEGPPTANGQPGIHHVLARAFKDIVLRFKTMVGYFVPRRAGWDTHGLPVELEVEKELGFNSKQDIEKFGVAKFNQKCKESVWKYKKEWEKLTYRMGFWLDFEDSYITYQTSYIESLWWIIKHFYDQKLLYSDYKVVPWCSRCGTSLSSHELGQPDAYRKIIDNSVYVKFEILDSKFKNTSILSWTTTPWTLPGNVALAINPKHQFVIIPDPYKKNYFLILQKQSFERLIKEKILPPNLKPQETLKAQEILGISYKPLFKIKSLSNPNSYKIYPADFVGSDEGTGVVHTAVMYGEDDYKLGKRVGLPTYHTVKENAQFIEEIPEVGGLYIITNKQKNLETENKILAYLEKNNFLFAAQKYEHEYPHCWRCKTPLIYYARNSWFVAVNKVRQALIKNNKKINWIPSYIKEGRFGQWLREKKDWNFSRERYWGTPLPIWICQNCKNTKAIGSIKELQNFIPQPKNKYLIMRHGESLTQIKKINDSGSGNYPLTTIGKDIVKKQAKKLLKENIDIIFASPIPRTKQTAEIVASIIKKEIIFDDRLKEINVGIFDGRPTIEYHKAFPTYQSKFELKPQNGESLRDVRKRAWNFLKDIESKYENKKILIISHEYPLWMLVQAAEGWDERKAISEKQKNEPDFIKIAEIKKLNFLSGPRNETGEFDLHKPYVDEVILKCDKCNGQMTRVKEVVDVWFDSGAMPYAQNHWPFEKNQKFNPSKNLPIGIDYPADYIVEAIDQTRGWFYTLLATSTLLGFKPPYKNVICLGLLLDKYGKKMSKSLGNTVNPWEMIEKYGIDVVRSYFYSSTTVGEPKNFDTEEILKLFRKFHLIIYNSFIFWQTYASRVKFTNPKKLKFNFLDKWILERLNQTIINVTNYLNKYQIKTAHNQIESFIDDLSRWYIRVSRPRFQIPQNKKDWEIASFLLGYILNSISKLLAPFCPFFAEALYQSTKIFDSSQKDSVHLTDWPKPSKSKIDRKLLQEMELIRNISSEVLKLRAEAGIKLRQPLARLFINHPKIQKLQKTNPELIQILKNEINIKEIIFERKLKEKIKLDTTITSELYAEGILRETTRLIQDLRNKANLTPKNKIKLFIQGDNSILNILEENKKILALKVNANLITFKKPPKFQLELDTQIDDKKIWIGIIKI